MDFKFRGKVKEHLLEWQLFFGAYFSFGRRLLLFFFWRFERVKGFLSGLLYRQRGRFAQPIAHFWLALFIFLGIALSPAIERGLNSRQVNLDPYVSNSSVMAYFDDSERSVFTYASSRSRGEIVDYTVRQGDTVSSIAKKFGVSIDTIIWANDIKSVTKIKPGDQLKIPPVTGVVHKVRSGETVYSIAKRYQANSQAIVDFPFNVFANDETFALAVGQSLVVPDGIMPKSVPSTPSQYTSQEVTVAVAAGSFIWPTSGRITQRYSWYHPAIDIANKDGPTVVAAASGTVASVVYSSWGYGNHIIINHGDGTQTLYGHLAKIYVRQGQSVGVGVAIGQMGSTGRSTGTHLHFEIIKGGSKLNPLSILQ
ncbi:MAG: M23 family metallopeptidase [Patescibacteria group bacterium]